MHGSQLPHAPTKAAELDACTVDFQEVFCTWVGSIERIVAADESIKSVVVVAYNGYVADFRKLMSHCKTYGMDFVEMMKR